MITFLVLGVLGAMAALVMFVVVLPFMVIGGVLRLLTLPLRLLFGGWGCRSHYGYGWSPWGGPRWRRRGAFARW